jgi:hypothetical protein
VRLATILLAGILVVIAARMVVLVLFQPGPNAGPEEPALGTEPFQEPPDELQTTVASVRAAGPFARASLAAGIACVVAAVFAGRRPGGPGFVRALGHVAFVLALMGAAAGFREVAVTAARIGPGLTPADTAESIDAALSSIVVGLAAEAVALACAGLLRLRPPKPPRIA